jgi:hypothetical protein
VTYIQNEIDEFPPVVMEVVVEVDMARADEVK